MREMNSPNNDNQLPKGTRAMIFAAGLGTRLKPFTDHHPKALAIVNGKPLLQRNIEYLQSFGIRDIMVNVHHFADQIEDFIRANDGFGCRVQLSHELDEPLETGGGLLKAAPYFLEQSLPFVVINADILTNLDLRQMYRAHMAHKPLATLAVTHRESSRNLLFNEEMQLVGWRNRKTGAEKMARPMVGEPTAMAFSAIHLIEPKLLKLVTQTGKFSIIDTYLDLAKDHDILGFAHDGDLVIDVGRPESVTEAEQYFH
jgi:N-acetyl-alpha-D-muramate 1-phosphate uridylyltransferase